MITKLLCLHGFSQNGDVLRAHLQELTARLPESMVCEFPDAPLECSAESVERLHRFIQGTRLPPPHRCFWDATDDGRVYRGWETTRELLRAHAQGADRLGILGFSQGAIVSAALCGLAARGEFPEIAFAVLVAGRKPRAEAMQGWFAPPLAVPSLHVWGERDHFAKLESPTLVECFAPDTRRVVSWRGPHLVPTRGEAGDAIVEFIHERCAAR